MTHQIITDRGVFQYVNAWRRVGDSAQARTTMALIDEMNSPLAEHTQRERLALGNLACAMVNPDNQGKATMVTVVEAARQVVTIGLRNGGLQALVRELASVETITERGR